LVGFSFFAFSFRYTDSCLGFGGVVRARRKASSRRFAIFDFVSAWEGIGFVSGSEETDIA
jgi:hypothetical protein